MSRLPMRYDKRCPCTPDCENRNAECRISCEAYKAYEATKMAEYDERLKADNERELRRAKTAGALRRSRNYLMRMKRMGR